MENQQKTETTLYNELGLRGCGERCRALGLAAAASARSLVLQKEARNTMCPEVYISKHGIFLCHVCVTAVWQLESFHALIKNFEIYDFELRALLQMY